MENNNQSNYNKSYDKQNYNNKRREIDVTKHIQEIDKKLTQKQVEITKQLEQKQEEINGKMDQKQEEVLKKLNDNLDEKIAISINKKMREEEKRFIGNKNRKIIVRDFIIIILLAVIGFLAYCLYDLDFYNIKTIVTNKEIIDNAIADKNASGEEKNEVDDNPSKGNENKVEEVKTSEYYIKNYGYLLENLQITGTNELYFYQNAITKDEISNNVKQQVAYKNLDADKKKTDNATITFKAKDLLESCKKVFGEEITINDGIFDYDNSKFLYYENTYLGLALNNEQVNSNIIYKIEKAYENNNELIFEVVAAKKQDTKLMNIVSEQPVIEVYNGEDILTYKDSLSHYKFTYSKDEDNYYFKNVELVATNVPEQKEEPKPIEGV